MNWDEIVAWSQSGAPEAAGLWDKLTDEERVEFLEATERWKAQWQAGGGERNRQDNTLLGGPPELAAAGAAGLASGGIRSLIDKVLGRKRLSGQNPLTNQVDPKLAGKRLSAEETSRLKTSSTKRRSPGEKDEFPAGTDRSTKPADFKTKQAEHAEGLSDDVSVVATRRKLASDLDKKPVQRRKPR